MFLDVLFVILAWIIFLSVIVLDCWRPGLHPIHIPEYARAWRERSQLAQEQPRCCDTHKNCCGILIKGSIMIPLILFALFGALILALRFADNICFTPLGYCGTIGCLCGNVVWQGYVFMFVVLTAGPMLLLYEMMRGKTKALCLKRFAGPKRGLDCLDFAIVWTAVAACLLYPITGLLPDLVHSTAMGGQHVSAELHLFGVFGGVVCSLACVLLVAYKKAKDTFADDKSSSSSKCKKFARAFYLGHHLAYACVGYSLLAAVILSSGLALTYLQSLTRHAQFASLQDVCVAFDAKEDCPNSTASRCRWQGAPDSMCIDPECDQVLSTALTCEYLSLSTGFATLIILVPAVAGLMRLPSEAPPGPRHVRMRSEPPSISLHSGRLQLSHRSSEGLRDLAADFLSPRALEQSRRGYQAPSIDSDFNDI